MEIEPFLLYLKNVKRYSPLTLIAYKKDLLQFIEFCENVECIQEWPEVTLDVVRHFEMELISRRSAGSKPKPKALTTSSVRRKMSSLRAFFRYLMHEGVMTQNPTENIILPKTNRRLPVFIPGHQMNELLEKDDDKYDFSVSRDLMILTMAYCTGMRRSELVGLKLDDLDLENCVVRILGKGNKQRIVPLLDGLKEEIRFYLLKRNEKVQGKHVFFFVTNSGAPINEKYLYRHVKSFLEKEFFLSKRSPHVLRHTFATSLLNNGACSEAISKLLGHSSLAATQIYAHNSFENLKRNYNQAHPRA
jgi:integrase/recombinase XerC